MIKEKIYIILEACKQAYGSDFTKKSRKRELIYARAAFISIVRNKYCKNAPLELIGDVLRGMSHATVLHAYDRAEASRDGRYLLEQEFLDVLTSFQKAIRNIMAIKDIDEIKSYTNDLVGTIEKLKDEGDYLKLQIVKLQENQKHDITFIDEINELPPDLKEEFERLKWMPFKKMQESRKHYKMNVEHKPVY